jgi:ABC-type multidrug transport system fused ATPase/permease subunit
MPLQLMWPFALLIIGTIPLMALARIMYARTNFGADEEVDGSTGAHGGILFESLVHIRTVFALSIENERFEMYKEALEQSEPNHNNKIVRLALLEGYQGLISRWVNALQFGWGGWLLLNYPHLWTFDEFVKANFSIIFAIVGLGTAFAGLPDKKEAEKAATRFFALLDRQSQIDPLSPDGLSKI